MVGKSVANLQVSVPHVTPVQGRLGGTSRKEVLTRLCGAVCTPSSALPVVFLFSQPSLVFFGWLGFSFGPSQNMRYNLKI